ncbi:histidine phosphatase family protein [Thalassobaculum sp.]|uniref:histidine phosphatase family protein n=1 Tax=Thalassobaculum sp. TaxID=2022740 RepID=UPI0032EE489E
MIQLVLLRHGPTEWNAARRLQGRSDIPLSSLGRQAVRRKVLPSGFREFRWLTSPLSRACETASLLGVTAEIEPALIEMDFGSWEGRTLAQVRAENPEAVALNEALGLDFRPAEGETPREIQARLEELGTRLLADGRDTAAVSHKGVIRAALALATGWGMTGKPPVRLDWGAAHLFLLDATGHWSLKRANIPLEPSE